MSINYILVAMSIQLGVNIGPTFSEFCLMDQAPSTSPKKSLGHRRHYTSSESTGTALKKFLSEYVNLKIDRVLVASNLMEKILDTKLGGSVAQVITAGFENWPYLRQNLKHRYFEMQPQRTEVLTSQEIIFEVHERINANGEIIKALDVKELEEIAQKLKEKNIEKICINFLFSCKNSKHEKIATDFFKSKNFEVFVAHQIETNQQPQDEILNWRQNLLNASLSGTFKEIRSEILSACEGHVDENSIYFIDGSASLFLNESSHISSSLFGPAQAMAQFYNNHSQVLVLGLEKWYFLRPKLKNPSWESPWGPLMGQVPEIQELKIQPTTEVVTNLYDQITWGKNHLGFEPGPMSFGRGLKPCLLDVLLMTNSLSEIAAFTNPNGISKFKSTFMAILKHTKSNASLDLEATAKELCDYLIDQIGLFILIEREVSDESVLCTGIYATALYPMLKVRWPEVKWEICPYAREVESMSVASLIENCQVPE